MVFIDPITGQRVVTAKHAGDIIYDLKSQTGSNVAVLESVAVIGGWMDWTGSGGPNSRNQQMWAGHENELWGTRAHIESKEDVEELTETGTSKRTTRTRVKKIYKKLD